MAGKTKTSGIDGADILRNCWRAAGFELNVSTQAGIKVTRPDMWVLRVSFLGMGRGDFERLMVTIKSSTNECVARYGRAVMSDSEVRFKAAGVGSQGKQYMHVAMAHGRRVVSGAASLPGRARDSGVQRAMGPSAVAPRHDGR